MVAKPANAAAISDVTHASKALADPTAVPKLANRMRIEPLHAAEVIAAAANDSTDSLASFDTATAKPRTAARAEAAASQQAADHEVEIAKLIDSQQYYLPINQVQQRRTKQRIWLTFALVLLLAAGWLYLLLDAGLVSIPGISVPTHFFK